jgi:alanine racemase
VEAALRAELTLTLHSEEPISALAELAMAQNMLAKLHIKVNTGMNRLGFDPSNVGVLLQKLHAYPHLEVEGIFTHFATADQMDQAFTWQQLTHFTQLLDELDAAHLRPSLAHAANSAAMLQFPAAHLDMVRCGIALYGLHPDAQSCQLPPPFQPVLSWKAQIVQLTPLRPGESVSYGRTFQAAKPMVVATIPVGYADGFPRSPTHWGSVLIHGAQAPIVGRVCMDQTVVDVTALRQRGLPVAAGDEVVLIGQQQHQHLTVDMIGQRMDTINYEVVSRIMPRVPRLLV